MSQVDEALTGQPSLGMLMVLMHVGVFPLLLRPALLIQLLGPLSFVLSVLFVSGVHTWNTSFRCIRYRAQRPGCRKLCAAREYALKRTHPNASLLPVRQRKHVQRVSVR